LQEVRFDPETGDFVVDEDVMVCLEHVRLEQERVEKSRREEEERRINRKKRISKSRNVYPETTVKLHQAAKVSEARKPTVNRYNQPYPCKYCGVKTNHWVEWLPSENVCVCRGCNKKRLKR
jgi:hypothetical protein